MDVERLSKLTQNQRAYLRMVLAHNSSKEIAQHFGISAHTVDKRLKEAMKLLDVTSRVHAARMLEAAEAAEAVQGLGAQSPDLANFPSHGTFPASTDHGYGQKEPVAATIREDQSIYRERGPERGFPLPFPTQGKRHNDLTILQRVGWTFALIIGLAIATGILLSGLTNLSMLITAIHR